MQKTYTRVLTIAGSDSGGGAGIQADLKTFSALGCYGMSVITALTAQNTIAVTGIQDVAPEFVALQIDAVLEDIGVDAVKIGMLSSPEIITVVAERLRYHNVNTVVLDPVMVAKSGDKLLRDEAIETLKTQLLPLATVITPNLPEAEVLTGRPIESNAALQEAAFSLVEQGPAVLIKGGHFTGERSDDGLALNTPQGPELVWLHGTRIMSKNTHGTGCTLSSAIAAYLAKGLMVKDAVQAAKTYIGQAIAAGADYQLGQGHGPVKHFYNLWHD